mmetsp:Transcript_30914/g.60867  ORF Transcript_30914/g.60867 Transcript_30914/m.60867 type:complete len:91 (+) Transcript_30914:1050-1322(+)
MEEEEEFRIVDRSAEIGGGKADLTLERTIFLSPHLFHPSPSLLKQKKQGNRSTKENNISQSLREKKRTEQCAAQHRLIFSSTPALYLFVS